jgi:phenylacetate-CoA ligase
LKDWLKNLRWVDAFDITDAELKKLAFDLERWQPEYIWGYLSTLELLASQIQQHHLQIRPMAVQSNAGTLYSDIRKRLEAAFGNVIFNRYGCREVSLIAHECSHHQGLHEFSPTNYVEIIPVDGDMGKVAVTNLHNWAFPFIRYEIGDLARRAENACTCGSRFPLLENIVGRSVEVIFSPSGKLIDGEFFTHLFYGMPGVAQFQVVQETREQLRICIVRSDDFNPADVERMINVILTHGDPRFVVDVEYVERIAPLRSGKQTFVLSNVPIELGQ